MATGKPESRTTHVIRIFGTNGTGDVLDDIWVDVERMDIAKTVDSDNNYQGTVRHFKWLDDPQGDDYNPDGNPARTEVTVKVCDPTVEDLENPDEWIPIKAIKRLKLVGSYNNFQGIEEHLINDELNDSRVIEKRRFYHYDTNIEDDAQSAADNGDKAYVTTGDNYTRDESTKDEDQYVEVEVIKFLKHRGPSFDNANKPVGGIRRNDADNQGKVTKLLNQYLIDMSDEAKLDEEGANGINPPYRLDPYQNIINISLGALAVEFYDGAT